MKSDEPAAASGGYGRGVAPAAPGERLGGPTWRGGVVERIREELLAAIERRDLPAGSLLPTERDLCQHFGASRMSVREALSTLAAIGAIRVERGRGAVVEPSAGATLTGRIASFVDTRRAETLEVLRVRSAIEERSAADASQCRDRPRLARLVGSAARFRIAASGRAPDVWHLGALDAEFHVSLASCGGGQLFADLVASLHDSLRDTTRRALRAPSRAAAFACQHDAILDAVLAGDADGARCAAAAHVAGLSEVVGPICPVLGGDDAAFDERDAVFRRAFRGGIGAR